MVRDAELREHVMKCVACENYADALHALEMIEPNQAWEHLWRAQLNRLVDNPRAALDDYEHMLQQNPTDSIALHGAAFIYATNPDATLRDGARALKYAKKLHALGPSCHSFALLAASYAECAYFVNATKSLQNALAIAPDIVRDRLTKRLEGYRNHQPCRISTAQFRSDMKSTDARCVSCNRPTFFWFNIDNSLQPFCLVCAPYKPGCLPCIASTYKS